jgi:hypothetical protein
MARFLSCLIFHHQKIVKHLRWGLPVNAENNPVLWGEVVTIIRTGASDLRSDWKKTVSEFVAQQHSG